MPMYNLLEYSFNYFDTTDSLWFYSNNEATDLNNDIENSGEFKSFRYKAKCLLILSCFVLFFLSIFYSASL